MTPRTPVLETPRGALLAPEMLEVVIGVLATDGLLIYPTDTLYALGGRALAPAVARSVRAAKGRDQSKPLPLVAADLAQTRRLTSAEPPTLETLATRFWPGPLTLVLPAGACVPPEVTAHSGTLAVRVPDVPLVRQLCAAAGPLLSTSANRAGLAAAVTCRAALDAVGEAAALALDGGAACVTTPSTIVDLTSSEPALLRAGAIPWAEIVAVLRGAAGRIDPERA